MSMNINKKQLENELGSIIHLRCFHGHSHAGISLSPVKNPKTKEFPSCVRNVDSNGNIILGKDDDPLEYFVRTSDRFYIKDGDEFNLNDPIKRKQWDAIKFSDLIFDSKGKKDEGGNYVVNPSNIPAGQAIYYVERIIEETKKKNNNSRKLNKALNYIYNASKDALRVRAMLLGKYIKDAYDEEIEEYIVDAAKNDPDKVINLFESDDTKYLIAFTYAKQRGIITLKGGLYTYNDSDILGRDSDSCISFMKNPKNKLITDRILKDIQEISIKDQDVIIDAIDEDNKRKEDLKKEAEFNYESDESNELDKTSNLNKEEFNESNESSKVLNKNKK